jgi:hypothetical protein
MPPILPGLAAYSPSNSLAVIASVLFQADSPRGDGICSDSCAPFCSLHADEVIVPAVAAGKDVDTVLLLPGPTISCA